MSGLIQDIAGRGVERDELARSFGNAQVGGERIPYEPKELASMVTILRGYQPKRYLPVEGVSTGGWRYIKEAVGIPEVDPVLPSQTLPAFCKDLRQPIKAAYDLISIDARGLPITAEQVWKFILGGKETVSEFGKGAPRDYGPAKIKSGTMVIFNLADPDTKDLYFKVRTLDNKLHQSLYAGMIKWS